MESSRPTPFGEFWTGFPSQPLLARPGQPQKPTKTALQASELDFPTVWKVDGKWVEAPVLAGFPISAAIYAVRTDEKPAKTALQASELDFPTVWKVDGK